MRFQIQRMLTPKPVVQTRQYYSHPRVEPKKEKPVPMFGQDPETMIGYSETRSSAPAPSGPRQGVAGSEFENVQGAVKSWAPNPKIPKMISHGVKEPSGSTDQEISPRGRSLTSAWDGKVRNKPSSSGLQGIRNTRQSTPADLHERDLKNYGYDFSG
jgi:hypothetical protein